MAAALFGGLRALADAPPVDTAGFLKVSIASEPHSLLPILATSAEESVLGQMMFDTLVEYDNRHRMQPDLATVVPTLANQGISADGLTITMHLRHDVHWHDGAPFTAADVVYTMHAIVDPRNIVANRTFYTNIRTVTASDPYTIVFRLAAPQGSFLGTVAGNYPIVPAHLLEKSADLATDPFNAHPIGTGPYRLERWLRGDRIEMAANPAYFRGAPKNPGVTAVVIADSNTLAIQLQQHAVEIGMVESSTYNVLRHTSGVEVTTEPLSDFNAFALNEKRPILRDPRVRRAIVLAVDRTTITRNVSFGTGTPAYADLPLFMYDGHPPAGWARTDPAAAERLLDDAGWKLGADGIRMKDGVPLRLDMIGYAGSASLSTIMLESQQMLRHVGIDVNVKTFAPALYFSPASAGGPMSGGNFDIGLLSFVNGDDPGNAELYACDSRIPAGNNYAGYCNPAMERLRAAAERQYDPQQRNRIIAQIEALAVHDSVYAFLYHTPYRFAFDPALKRVPASIGNRFYDIRDWTR